MYTRPPLPIAYCLLPIACWTCIHVLLFLLLIAYCLLTIDSSSSLVFLNRLQKLRWILPGHPFKCCSKCVSVAEPRLLSNGLKFFRFPFVVHDLLLAIIY